ncbi:MAG: adenosylcobinamide-GDP ribazoletransferase [Actinophytocola sp.]|uniref:adenosylcobinamide-GDP ribazoletransferase n=1 Tax=Actinophytocola sp. TaxID=1872138 RepID=UPI00132C5575|nr:adenosylcobinamide-GDP ribazoletransferase [Actinophytocola sp.]MPZ83344.1 adenosylcobinamide-GDP ribazoletransferase [Actinophytocola sp.]
MGAALRLALSWLTVLPAGHVAVDREVGGRAIALAPVIGVVLGLPAAGLASLLRLTDMPGLLAGLLTVGLLALATRGMHLDGLADTADGLGCYGPPERALAVMRDGGVGPFGVVTLVVVLGAQASAFGALAGHRWWAIVLAVVAGRVAFAACCLRGVPAARPEGLGALVAGTQHVAVPAAWLAGLLMVSVFVDRDAVWLGPVAVIVAAVAVVGSVAHVRRRLGGVTGDVLGATCEVATTIVAATCTFG